MYWNFAAATSAGITWAGMTCSAPLSMVEFGPWQVLHCVSLATIFAAL